MAMSQYWADLEQQEYDPDEFVERLAFRARSGGGGGGELGEAQQLHATFLTAINDLRSMHEKQVSKCMELEEQCREEEKQHWARVAALIQARVRWLKSSYCWFLEEQGGSYHLQKP